MLRSLKLNVNGGKTFNPGNLTGGSTVLSLLLIISFWNSGFSKDWLTSWVELVGEGKLGKWSFLRCYLQALGSRRSRCLSISWCCYWSMQQIFRIQVQYTLSYVWSAQVKWNLHRINSGDKHIYMELIMNVFLGGIHSCYAKCIHVRSLIACTSWNTVKEQKCNMWRQIIHSQGIEHLHIYCNSNIIRDVGKHFNEWAIRRINLKVSWAGFLTVCYISKKYETSSI
jgi:hypothetical protein